MKFEASRESLLHALTRVLRVVKSNPRAVEILQCVKVYDYAGSVFIEAVSPSSSVRVTVRGATLHSSGAMVVQFDKLKDRIAKTSGEVILETSDGIMLHMSSDDDQRLGIKLNDPREFPETHWVDPEESYGMSSSTFIELLEDAAKTTKDVSSLTPAFMQTAIKDRQMVAATGVTYFFVPVDCHPELSVRLPISSIGPVVGFVTDSEIDRVWISQGNIENIVVTAGLDQYQANSLNVGFPDLSSVLENVEVRVTDEFEVDRKRLVSEINKAVTSSGEDQVITLKIEGVVAALLKVCSSSGIGDYYEGTMPCTWTGDGNRELQFTYGTLVPFLNMFRSEKVNLTIGDDFKGSPTPMYCKEGERIGIINQYRL